jgi:HEAT repeat protein
MGLFSKRLTHETLKSGTAKQVVSHFTGKKVVLEELDLVRTALEEPDIRERLRTPEVVQTFADLLTTGDEVARERSVQILGLLGLPEAIPALTRSVQSDENSWIRGDAAIALGRIGTDAVMDPLIDACLTKDFAVSLGAAEALAGMGDPRGIQAIVDKIASLADEGVLAGMGAVGPTHFYIWPQYKKALQGLSSRSAAEALIPLLEKLYDHLTYRSECASDLIAIILNTGEETAEKLAAVLPQDVLNKYLEHHRKYGVLRP